MINGGKLQMGMTWKFEVTHQEMFLILKALGGRLKEEEYDDAEALCDQLTQARINATREQMTVMERLEEALEAKN